VLLRRIIVLHMLYTVRLYLVLTSFSFSFFFTHSYSLLYCVSVHAISIYLSIYLQGLNWGNGYARWISAKGAADGGVVAVDGAGVDPLLAAWMKQQRKGMDKKCLYNSTPPLAKLVFLSSHTTLHCCIITTHRVRAVFANQSINP
jgi:hypothetical protein